MLAHMAAQFNLCVLTCQPRAATALYYTLTTGKGCLMFNIIGWIVVGFITGWISLALIPGNQNLGFIWTTLLGIGGAFVGGFIGSVFTKEKDMGKLNKAGFLMSIVGGMVLIALVGLFR